MPAFSITLELVDDSVANLAVACNLGAVAEHARIAHLGVVADVSTFHEEVVVAYHCLAAGVGGTVDYHVLADDVVVAHNELALLAAEVEVLRQCSYHRSLVYLVALAHACSVEDAHKRKDYATVAYLYIVLDIGEGEYLAVVADLRFWRHFGSWTYLACHKLLFVD